MTERMQQAGGHLTGRQADDNFELIAEIPLPDARQGHGGRDPISARQHSPLAAYPQGNHRLLLSALSHLVSSTLDAMPSLT
jgi:hypothetical protein